MAKRKRETPGETLQQLESASDRIAEWIGDNPLILLGSGFAVLVAVGIFALLSSSRESSRLEASDALSAVESKYRGAMGSDPDSIEISEPANPETAREVRREYEEHFRSVAREHPGTVAAALAWIEVGGIQEALGEPVGAIGSWTAALEETSPDQMTRSLLWVRIAAAREDLGEWMEAAAAYQAASEVRSYPLRYNALADAARCYAEAGEAERAIAAFDTVLAEAPDHVVPDHVRSRVAELRAGLSSG